MSGRIDSLYTLRSPVPPLLIAPDTSYGPDFSVSWTHEDQYNPAVEFELVEMTDYSRFTDSCNDFDNWINNDLQISTSRYHSAPASFYCPRPVYGLRYVLLEYIHEIEESDTLSFWTYYELIQDYDYGFVVAISNDTGYVIEGNITTSANPHGFNPGNGFTGSSEGWVEAKFDLSAFAGRFIAIALASTANSFDLAEGVYFDDIYPLDRYNTINNYSINGTENSYLLTGKLEKPYYYQLRAKDIDDQWGEFSALEKTVVQLAPPYICGDASGDENVNVSDAVYIINYVFIGGAAPDPFEAGDTNCDGNVNVSDAVWIINYVFVGGNIPCDVDGDSQPDC
jgi:hypothetical protein